MTVTDAGTHFEMDEGEGLGFVTVHGWAFNLATATALGDLLNAASAAGWNLQRMEKRDAVPTG